MAEGGFPRTGRCITEGDVGGGGVKIQVWRQLRGRLKDGSLQMEQARLAVEEQEGASDHRQGAPFSQEGTGWKPMVLATRGGQEKERQGNSNSKLKKTVALQFPDTECFHKAGLLAKCLLNS